MTEKVKVIYYNLIYHFRICRSFQLLYCAFQLDFVLKTFLHTEFRLELICAFVT